MITKIRNWFNIPQHVEIIFTTWSGQVAPGVFGYARPLGHDSFEVGLFPENISRSYTTELYTLCHEFAHIKQYLDGRLKFVDTTLLQWEGTIYPANGHQYQPWELDAIMEGWKLFTKLCTDKEEYNIVKGQVDMFLLNYWFYKSVPS